MDQQQPNNTSNDSINVSSNDDLIYMNSLTQQQSIPTARHALYTLLSSTTTNPRIISLQTPIYHASFGDQWKAVGDLPDLRAAGSLYYHLLPGNQPSRTFVTVGDLVRMMDNGEADGMTMLTSTTYPNDGNEEWMTLGDERMAELKDVVRMLSKGDDSFVGETQQGEATMGYEGGVEDELASFLKSTAGGELVEGGGAWTALSLIHVLFSLLPELYLTQLTINFTLSQAPRSRLRTWRMTMRVTSISLTVVQSM